MKRLIDRACGLELLRRIGDMLDQDMYPHVSINGQVTPGPDQSVHEPGNCKGEQDHAVRTATRTHGPEAGQGKGTAAGGAADETGTETFLLSESGLTDALRRDLGAAAGVYPSMRIRVAPPVVWLLTLNRPILGLPDSAYVLTCLSLDPRLPLRGQGRTLASWAWWDLGVWIGPRHTNYGDGSICSFEPKHGRRSACHRSRPRVCMGCAPPLPATLQSLAR